MPRSSGCLLCSTKLRPNDIVRYEVEMLALRDTDIRAAAMGRLLMHARSCPDTKVVEELGLSHGAARVDIAVINGHIRGIEIKAEADTLIRLPRQVSAYGQVVDRATLIAAERHIEGASVQLPDWWGIIEARRCANGAVIFRRLRDEKANRGLEPITLARLLWRPEVAELLRQLGADEALLRAPRTVLYTELVAALPLSGLRRVVRDALKTRENWRDRIRPLSYGGLFQPNAKC
jgi:hypothetical protein